MSHNKILEIINSGVDYANYVKTPLDYREDNKYLGYEILSVLPGICSDNEREDLHNKMKYYSLIPHKSFDTFLYFCPFDKCGFIFDFSENGKIICYDGITKKFKREIVKEMTYEEFAKIYGRNLFISVSHYKVFWSDLGFEWNN